MTIERCDVCERRQLRAGWFFLPEDAGPESHVPAVAMAHGVGAVKEMYLEPLARPFAEAGVAVVLCSSARSGRGRLMSTTRLIRPVHVAGRRPDAPTPPSRSKSTASAAFEGSRTMSTAILQEVLLADQLAELARAYAESQAFVSLLAHELRTRLKVTERALSSPGGDVDTALENTRTVQELLETLLELARGQSVDSADADAAVRRVLDELREDVELLETAILAGKLPFVRMPQALLEAVLHNLLANA